MSCPPDRPMERVGPADPRADGGKWLCSPAALGPPCVVISMGSNMDFSFEEAVLARTRCDVVTLDCTVDGRTLGPRHSFYKLCVGSRDAAAVSKDVVTYSQLVTTLRGKYGKAAPTFLLKIDVEAYEFPSLAEWHEDTQDLPEQIAIELHYKDVGLKTSEPFFGRHELSTSDLALFFAHMANLGYGIVSREINEGCPACCEFTLMRVEVPTAATAAARGSAAARKAA